MDKPSLDAWKKASNKKANKITLYAFLGVLGMASLITFCVKPIIFEPYIQKREMLKACSQKTQISEDILREVLKKSVLADAVDLEYIGCMSPMILKEQDYLDWVVKQEFSLKDVFNYCMCGITNVYDAVEIRKQISNSSDLDALIWNNIPSKEAVALITKEKLSVNEIIIKYADDVGISVDERTLYILSTINTNDKIKILQGAGLNSQMVYNIVFSTHGVTDYDLARKLVNSVEKNKFNRQVYDSERSAGLDDLAIAKNIKSGKYL